MITAKFEELRDNLPQIEAWLQSGEEIELTRDGAAVAKVVPTAPRPTHAALVKPDFAARLKETWGDFIFTDEQVQEMRQYELGDRS